MTLPIAYPDTMRSKDDSKHTVTYICSLVIRSRAETLLRLTGFFTVVGKVPIIMFPVSQLAI